MELSNLPHSIIRQVVTLLEQKDPDVLHVVGNHPHDDVVDAGRGAQIELLQGGLTGDENWQAVIWILRRSHEG